MIRRSGWARIRRAIAPLIALIAAAAAALATPNGAWSQTRTIRLVVPFAPAGGTDILARLVANYISQKHGPTVVVENRPGAGTVIATEAVARAAPDGNTVLIVGNSFVINPNMKKLSYDPLTSFEPICHLTRSPNIVAVHAASRLPHARRPDRRGPRQAGRDHDGGQRPGDLTAYRLRDAQARGQGRFGLRAVPGRRPCGECAARPARGFALLQLSNGGRNAQDPANYGRLRSDRGRGSSRCRTCRRSPSPATRTTRRTSGSGWSRRPRRPRRA